MKKAKKILSLMLVVAMALSMMVFTGGTASAKSMDDFTDIGNITHKEAVDLLSALEIMVGYDATTFGPETELTREVAATIIARILRGTAAANALVSANTGFDDVDSERWSSGYIAYCVNVGIINGYGDGRFGPEDPVTASQLAKMLLMALGYGKNGEFSNPNTWEMNAVVAGQEYGILSSSVNVDFTKPATREQVALYTFQTITQPTITYNELFKTYSAHTNPLDSSSTLNPSLAGRVFGVTVNNSITDSNGFPARMWMRNNIALTKSYATGIVLKTYKDGALNLNAVPVPICEGFPGFMFGNSGGAKGGLATYSYDTYVQGGVTLRYDETTIPVYINGVLDATQNNTDGIAFSQIPGNIVQYVDADYDNLVDKIIVTQKWAYTVTSAPVTAGGKVSIPATYIPNALNPNGTQEPLASVDAIDIEYPADLAAGDIILVYTRLIDATTNRKAIVVEKAKTVTGTLTSFSAFGITFGGAVYSGSALGPVDVLAGITNNSANFGIESTIWVDDNNAIIAFKAGETAVTTSYGLLVGYEYNGLSLATGATAKAAVYGTDGVYKVYSVAAGANSVVPNQRGGLTFTEEGKDETLIPAVITYSLNDNGEITFSAAAGTDSEPAITYTPGTATMDLTQAGITGYLTANTVFFYYDGSTDPVKFAVKTGYANALKIDGDNIDYVMSASGGVVLAVYVKAEPPAAFGNYAYVTSAVPVSTEYVSTTAIYSYSAYVNGESTIIKSKDAALFGTTAGLYGYTVDASGYAVDVDPSGIVASETISRVEPSYVAYDNGVAITDSNTKFYMVQTVGFVTTVFEAPIVHGPTSANYKLLGIQPGPIPGGTVTAIYYTIDMTTP